MTDAELKLWNAVRAGRLMELKFRRQMPIAGFIVDFACPSHRLVIELDGSQHGEEHVRQQDESRSKMIESLGWTIIRFWNDDILKDIDGVCQHIVLVAAQMKAAMQPA